MQVSGIAKHEIHTLFNWGILSSSTDSELLVQFLSRQESSEAAFRALIQRHGPMVLAICRRVLGEDHAAEDAFQSTFLVLVRKAGALRDKDLLANWLHGVALRISKKERARIRRRLLVEQRSAEPEPGKDSFGNLEEAELRSLIDEEIHRLPEHYRVPLVLCHLQGMRHDEVARRLGCPVGTVESRLSRAREQLRSRLTRRGLAPSEATLSTVLLLPQIGATPHWTLLADRTLKAALELVSQHYLSAWVSNGLLATRHLVHAHALRIATAVVILGACGGLSALGIAVHRERIVRMEEGIRASNPSIEPQHSLREVALASAREEAPAAQPKTAGSEAAPPTPRIMTQVPLPTPRIVNQVLLPSRSPSALAFPISGISIDGNLDDWPDKLPRHAIKNHLTVHPRYARRMGEAALDPDAYFMVGYDKVASLLYLAVVVRDQDFVVHPAGQRPAGGDDLDNFATDAVEVYVDGTFSRTKIPVPSGSFLVLDAAKMPVLQYVGVPGDAPAYANPFGENPTLMYRKTREGRTRMKYRRDKDVTAYEWAIQVYDRFPDQPTRLAPGKRIGLEVTVVDKDALRDPPAFVAWGPLTENYSFKGCDAGSLGELILADGPQAP